MTLKEVEKLAENGDVKAMMALADYYSKLEDENGDEVAFKYYELAANAGEPNALIKMVQTSSQTADAVMSMIDSGGKIPSMDEPIEKAYRWALKLKYVVSKMGVSDKNTLEFVDDKLLKALSRLATLYYFDKKYTELIDVTQNIDAPYAQAVHGLAIYQIAETGSDLTKAFHCLKNIENSACWKKEYQTKYGQILLVEAAMFLSGLYRAINNDVDSAYRAMSLILDYSVNESMRENVKEDIAAISKRRCSAAIHILNEHNEKTAVRRFFVMHGV